MTTRATLLDFIIEVLRQHVGRENAISSKQIARELGMGGRYPDRRVRQLIHDALHDETFQHRELAVCSAGGGGFFIAKDIEEAQSYADWCSRMEAEARRKSRAVRSLFSSMGIHLQPVKK